MKILFFGDIVARAGRQAVAEVLPQWRQKYSPDVVIGCVDNLAHGKGATSKTLQELISLGFDAFTTGDHVMNSPAGVEIVSANDLPVVRPLNAPAATPGSGAKIISAGNKKLLLVHLMGQVFINGDYSSPFAAIDMLLTNGEFTKNIDAIVVDIHAEATSEKVALGWYLDGRVAAVLGTHTHIPTSDNWVLPKGTAYVTDVGMSGIRESVLGVKTEIILDRFVNQGTARFEPAEKGMALVTAMLVDFDCKTSRAASIERLSQGVTIA